MKRALILLSMIFAFCLGWVLGILAGINEDKFKTTVARLSPNEAWIAELGEPQIWFNPDRYVTIRLKRLYDENHRPLSEHRPGGNWKFLYQSMDEGRPEGTERLIWSKDGTKLLVVGRHFFVKKDLFLDNGDQLYFLHDVPSGKGWSNADKSEGFPQLTAAMIEGVEFTEPVTLKPR